MERSFAPQVRRWVDNSDKREKPAPRLRRTKLMVGSASDPAEAQADRAADAVMATIARQDVLHGAKGWPSETRIRRSTAVVEGRCVGAGPASGSETGGGNRAQVAADDVVQPRWQTSRPDSEHAVIGPNVAGGLVHSPEGHVDGRTGHLVDDARARGTTNRIARRVLPDRLHAGSATGSPAREADRLAAEVMRELASTVGLDDRRTIPRSIAPGGVGEEGGPLDPGIESRIQRSRGSGSPLPEPLRHSMESSFGVDFGRVRLHTGPSSDELNRSMQSRAFTIGGDIFFGRNEYRPGSQAGQTLLAHELAHTVQQGAAGLSVQRFLVDVDGVAERFEGSGFAAVNQPAWTAVFRALLNYRRFMERKLAPGDLPSLRVQPDEAAMVSGSAFYDRIQTHLRVLRSALDTLRNHKKARKLDKSWLNTLIEQDIPQTVDWAAKVRANFADYKGMTPFEALRDARNNALIEYLTASPSWDEWSEAERQLLRQNRDSDAATVAAIRNTAKAMLDRKESPKAILSYMSIQVKAFVKRVIRDYIEAMDLEEEPFVVVSAGSFVKGELFPFSDIDIQLMKAGLGDTLAEAQRMDLMLDNIRTRIRLASTKEFGGKLTDTKGWDVDQLSIGAYTAENAAAIDQYRGLVYTDVIAASGGGQSEATALQTQQRQNLVAHARRLMDMALFDFCRQGNWWVTSPNELDAGAQVFEYKEKFLQLPKVYLNVLAMFHNLHSVNSWSRVDELVNTGIFSKKLGSQFKTYLDITSTVRLRYQFFYEQEGLDFVAPGPTTAPADTNLFPKGYYVLTPDDRKLLKKAQAIQAVLVQEVYKTADALRA